MKDQITLRLYIKDSDQYKPKLNLPKSFWITFSFKHCFVIFLIPVRIDLLIVKLSDHWFCVHVQLTNLLHCACEKPALL
jgi:hypothetical protein